MREGNVAIHQLHALVSAGDYKAASQLCLNQLERSPQDRDEWRLQLAYVYFLDAAELETHHNVCPALFESLVEKNPLDLNARFWLAYVRLIVLCDERSAKEILDEVINSDKAHPYANLVSAGLKSTAPPQRIALLRRCLGRQPENLRALCQLADTLLDFGNRPEARDTLERILRASPYVEHDLGIMNEYVNDVLTGASHSNDIRKEARRQLNQPEFAV